MSRFRWVLSFALLSAALLLGGTSGAQNCEVCDYGGGPTGLFRSAKCAPAKLGEMGRSQCNVVWGKWALTSACEFGGAFCEEIIVIGGPGGGSGGGGGGGGGSPSNPCATNGFCPATCF